MKCNWCGEGKGSNRTKDKEGNIFYYFCKMCLGFKINEQDKHAKALLKQQEEES